MYIYKCMCVCVCVCVCVASCLMNSPSLFFCRFFSHPHPSSFSSCHTLHCRVVIHCIRLTWHRSTISSIATDSVRLSVCLFTCVLYFIFFNFPSNFYCSIAISFIKFLPCLIHVSNAQGATTIKLLNDSFLFCCVKNGFLFIDLLIIFSLCVYAFTPFVFLCLEIPD